MSRPYRKRDIPIYLMVTSQEKDLIQQKMEQAQIRNMSAYLRKMAIDGYVIRMDLSDVREMVRLLRITSNNINQIAKRANETWSLHASDVSLLQNSYALLWSQTEEILKNLTKLKQ